jgi:hypothetical protein
MPDTSGLEILAHGIAMMMMMMLYLFKEFSKESYKKEALLSPCIGSIKT